MTQDSNGTGHDGAGTVTADEAAAMLRAVLNLFGRWCLAPDQGRCLLGNPPEETYQQWCLGETGAMPHDTVLRLGILLGIHVALRSLFTVPGHGYSWVAKPNDAFGGRSALERMLQGTPGDLAAVFDYLEGELRR